MDFFEQYMNMEREMPKRWKKYKEHYSFPIGKERIVILREDNSSNTFWYAMLEDEEGKKKNWNLACSYCDRMCIYNFYLQKDTGICICPYCWQKDQDGRIIRELAKKGTLFLITEVLTEDYGGL